MREFFFNLQRFADVQLSAGKTYELDGVTYTAVTDAVLNLDSDNKISGIASGKVSAVVADAENSPSISFDATEKSLAFTLKAEDGALVATNSYGRERTITLTEGTLSVEGYNIVAGAAKFFLNSSSGRNYTFESENSATYSIDDGVFTAASDNLKITVSEGTSSSTALEFSGKVTRVLTENSYTLNKDTTVSFATEHGSWTLTSTDDNSGSISLSTSVIQITSENEGALSIKAKNNESNYVNFNNITGTINFTGTGFTLNDGSTLGGEWIIDAVTHITSYAAEGGTATVAFDGETATYTVSEDATLTFNVNANNHQMILHSGSFIGTRANSTCTLTEGSVIEVDGVTYTSLDGDAVLNLDDDFKISGIASGKVTAVVTGAENSPTVTFDASQTTLPVAVTKENNSLAVTFGGRTFKFAEGTATIARDKVTMGAAVFSVSGSYSNADYKFTVADSAEFSITADSFSITSEKVSVDVIRGGRTLNFGISGTAIRNFTDHTFALAGGTSISTTLSGYTFNAKVPDGASVGFNLTESGIIFKPGENNGSIAVSVNRGDTPLFGGNVSVSGGSIGFNLATQSLSFTKGTTTAMSIGNYTFEFTATDDISSKFAIDADGNFIFTPGENDGSLNVVLKKGATPLFGGNVSVSDGSIGFNHTTKEISFTKGTEMQIDFGDGYIVNFKTTDDAGGKISLDADGLTFTPTEGDGHLELSVTRGGETRTATLEMTGSLTYKLDGSISLAKDTVVKNIFEDGNILTITANTDASGSMIFDPNSGLYITPSTPDALNVVLTTDGLDVVNISSITGTINYTGGVVTASDGTKAHISYYFGWESELRTTGGTASIQFTADRTVYTANEGSTFLIDYLDGTTSEIQNGTYSDIYATETEDAIELISAGSTFKCNDEEVIFTLESAGSYTLNGIAVTTTAANTQVQLTNYDTVIVDGISYTPLDDNVTLTIGDTGATCAGGKVSLQMEGFDIALSEDVTDGSISYNSTTNKFTVKAGAKSYLGEGKFPDQFVAKNDFDISVTKTDDGKFKFSLGDESVSFDLTRNGTAIMGSTITLDGSIIVDPTNNEISLPKDTVLTMTPGTGKTLQITALDNAGGELTLANGGLRFKPNENDGALEFNFVDAERKATLDVTGAFTYKGLGALSLEDGTVANLTWTDGTKLKITSSGSTGSIGIDPDKGIKITSDDENLNMTLTTPYMSTDISGIKGTIYYKEGNVSFDENSKITATTTLGGQPILTTLKTIDGTGHISFSGTTNGIVYSADTGAMKITWSRDNLESTFVVNKGSIQIGHNLFRIAEGSDIATDLKTFVPALYFTTAEAGTYTINGQKITTSAEGLALTATDDQMVFKTSGDVVEYDGMTFAGNGNVSLSSDNVVLGAGVEATGFGKDKSFVLAEPGQVTADEKVFELTQVYLQKDGESIPVPLKITVTGAEDGFIFSRTTTEESEEYQGFDPPEVGVNFTEKFVAEGDNSYRTRTDPFGLQEVIGISADTTITGGASFGGEPSYNYFDIVTETNGKFVIGEKVYVISEGSTVGTKLTAHFDENGQAYARGVKDLNGTVSGDFSAYKEFKVNENPALKLIGDTDISIVADDSGYEILGLDKNASLQVSAADTYKVNGTEITAGAQDVIVGTGDGKARLYTLPAALADFMLHKTEAGYPAMAALAFHPDEADPEPPTNYHSAEKWTTNSIDDLQLSAMHYSPENPTGKWVILVHGYGKKGAAMNASAEPYLAQGLDVLIVDQRTAGDSEGDWLTMGVAEANDLAIWTQEIAKTNANAQITLHGVSMGAATVMLCAALPETANLSAMIEDCGYGNIADVFATLLTYYGSSLGVGDVDFYELFDDVAEVAKIFDGGYDVGDAAPIDSISAVTVPSLFIHGAADVVIPSTNADALYEASGASNKTKLIIEGAGHAKSIELDTEAYLAAVKKLIDSSTTEIGALIDSDADSKLLRGTIYDDTITNSGQSVTIEALDGDDYVTNNVDSSVTAAEFGNLIELGDGNDTIYNHHSYNPTIYGGAGDDSIVISRGHKTFADGGDGNDSIIGRLADNPDSDWAIGGHATVLGGEDDDYINTGYTNDSTIDGGKGNDTIITCGSNNTIDGGEGKNLISVTAIEREDLSESSFIVLNGQTTVEGFKTGFGEGTDTVYIKGESPAVDFKTDGLTLYYDDDKTKSLTFAGLSTTDKLNLYYEASLKSVSEVFIADDEWYSVTENDLSVRDDSELWFVGATAKMNHGVDFSGISDALNISLNTDYEADVEGFRINNIHSIKGGAGLTTITGSNKDDTIIAGKGKTTINAAKGDDNIILNSAAALVEYNSGDGNDTITGFNENSTLNVAVSDYSSAVSGDDIVVKVGKEKITLVDAASLDEVNIVSAGLNINNTVNNTIITGTEIGDTIENSGTAVTIKALGGDDYIVNNVDSSLVAAKLANSIDAGNGNDTIYSYHTYNPTLLGGADDDSIVVENGHRTFANGGKGNDTIIGISNVDGWGMGDYATIIGGEGDDYINPIYSAGASINGGDGNDTILANGENATIDGGDGNNLIVMTDAEGGVKGKFIVLNGNTTVEGFNTGFESDLDPKMGEGTDTIYIDGDPAGVYFKDGVLTFANSTDSLTLSDVTTTAKVNIYHKRREVLNKGVFIADNDWYSVSSSDLFVNSGEEVYFVGPSATQNHGVDFSGITQDLNVTIDTAYVDSEDYVPTTMWINGVYSLKGGAGNTTITGSDKNDTIIAGTGKTTINAAAGDDFIRLGSASALVEYNYGDGNDLIQGFRANSTLSISGGEYYSKKHGADLILTVGKDEITLQGAARLSSANIIGTTSVEGEIAARTNGYVNNYYDYGTPITDQSNVKKLLEGDLNGDMAFLLENKSADFSKSTGRKNVTLIGGENQDVAFNKEGRNTAVVDENTGGEKNILLGGGGDLVFVEDTDAQVNITASKSNDIIVSKGENVFIDLKGGQTDLFAVGGRMLLNGYDASNNSGFGTNYADILAAINDGDISFNKGKMSIDSAVVAFNGAKSGVVNIFDLAGNIQKVGFASNDAELNASDETADLILVGKENSTLISGSGNDTIFADEGSHVDAGAGKNYISIEERDENDYGVTIVLDSSGKNTIANFQSGFDYASDTLFFGVNDTIAFKFDGTNLTVQNNDNSQCAFIENIASDAPFVEISAADDNAPVKIVAAKKDAIITVDDELADWYIGEKSGVDFTNYAGDLAVNLGSAEGSIGGGEVLFSGINQITAGKGNATIIGSKANETLVAGIGENSIYGGGGKNLLIGNTSEDKFGSTEFFVLGTNNGAQHTIRGFEFIEDGGTNRDTFDALSLDLAKIEVTDIKVVDSNVEVAIKSNENGAFERFTIEGAAGKEFLVDRGGECETVAQIAAKEVTVKNDYVDFYYASDKNATVKVGDIKSAKIWLESPEHNDGVEFVGDFTVIDARGSSAEVDMGGNSVSNTIYGGLGNASLWGGSGGNDLLVGGSGQNMFSYMLGNGSDTITGVNDGDTVDLAGVTLDDIISADFTNNALALNFSDGGKLTVNENGKGVNFLVGDQTFYVNNEHNGFVTDK